MLRNERNAGNYWDQFAATYDDKLERMMGKAVRQNLFRMLERERGLECRRVRVRDRVFHPGDRGGRDARYRN